MQSIILENQTVARRELVLQNNLARLRGSRSVDEVAKAVGITRMALHKLEKGLTAPSRQNMVALSRYFRSPISFDSPE